LPQPERAKVVRVLETTIGKIARPKEVRIVPDMPKTRSGKIMRRVLAAISNSMDVGDVTTLANPEIVEQIRIMVQGEAKVAAKTGQKTSRHSAKNSQFRVSLRTRRIADLLRDFGPLGDLRRDIFIRPMRSSDIGF
jgi:AMP-binding enzyme C-terminal domain